MALIGSEFSASELNATVLQRVQVNTLEDCEAPVSSVDPPLSALSSPLNGRVPGGVAGNASVQVVQVAHSMHMCRMPGVSSFLLFFGRLGWG